MDIIAEITEIRDRAPQLWTRVAEYAIAENRDRMAENHANQAARWGAKWTFRVITAK